MPYLVAVVTAPEENIIWSDGKLSKQIHDVRSNMTNRMQYNLVCFFCKKSPQFNHNISYCKLATYGMSFDGKRHNALKIV